MANTYGSLTSLFTAIANALRSLNGTSAQIVADDFPSEISNIPMAVSTTFAITGDPLPTTATITISGVDLSSYNRLMLLGLVEQVNADLVVGCFYSAFGGNDPYIYSHDYQDGFKSSAAMVTFTENAITIASQGAAFAGTYYAVIWKEVGA